MKLASILAVALVLIAGFMSLAHSPAQGQVQAPLAKWEYKVSNGALDEARLNQLGDEGWELAAAESNVTGGGGQIARGDRGGTISSVRTTIKLVFKRPKR